MSAADELLGPFLRLLKDVASIDAVRAAEDGPAPTDMWEAIIASGFADALISEQCGGAGLSMADVHPLFVACGQHLLPPALGQTMLARALISSAGQIVPNQAIVLWPESPDGQLRSLVPPAAGEGTMALTQCGSVFEVRKLRVIPECIDGFGLLSATLAEVQPLISFEVSGVDLLDYAAASVAATMAGAMTTMVDMSLAFANERQQFGRALSAFQAIQHQLSVACEEVVLATTASRIAFTSTDIAIDPIRAAIAKAIANDAASAVCSIAHAVHGAVGITAEYDLQLYSRRLRRWQVSFGSTEFWLRRIGSTRLSSDCTNSVDFIRQALGVDTDSDHRSGGLDTFVHDAGDRHQ